MSVRAIKKCPAVEESVRDLGRRAEAQMDDGATVGIAIHEGGKCVLDVVLADAVHRVECRTKDEAVRVRAWFRSGGWSWKIPDDRAMGVSHDEHLPPEEFPEHEAAGLFPMMTPCELDALAEDIRTNGLAEDIIIFKGKLLDGRNRLKACALAGVRPRFEWLHDGDEIEPVAYVLSKNLHRRHLTPEQRRRVIAAVLKQDPKRSDRRVAEETKTDHKTVGKVREQLEGRGEIPHVDKRSDSKGREQPAARPRPAESPAPGGGNGYSPAEIKRRGKAFDLAAGCINCLKEIAGFKSDPARGRDLEWACEAIECLMRIPKDNEFREEGFRKVTDWIKHNVPEAGRG
jgi:hypothetical protein